MKRKLVMTVVTILLAALWVPAAVAQMGQVRGIVKDPDGNPAPNLQVQLLGVENGRKYNLKTNKKGEFISIGVSLGVYNVKVLQDGKQVYEISGFPVKMAENDLNINLERAQDGQAPLDTSTKGLNEEQKKQLQEAIEANKKNQAEASKVKELNDMLAQATAAENAGNLDQAISVMKQAVAADGTRDVLWSKLAEYERLAGAKATDPQERTQLSTQAVQDYQKAIDTTNEKTPPVQVAAYYNNMGQAYGRMNKTDEAAAAYEKAAELDPANAAKYYFNTGAVMTNGGKIDAAIAAFDKTIAADPNHAEAYYWKGVNLVGKSTLQGDKMVAPPGTEEAFNKYLELQPTGQFASAAKEMLTTIGGKVQTSFGKEKATKKK
jgi:tetratricopeptide (TPR) repeat protein